LQLASLSECLSVSLKENVLVHSLEISLEISLAIWSVFDQRSDNFSSPLADTTCTVLNFCFLCNHRNRGSCKVLLWEIQLEPLWVSSMDLLSANPSDLLSVNLWDLRLANLWDLLWVNLWDLL
jgi:hypothetical protein